MVEFGIYSFCVLVMVAFIVWIIRLLFKAMTERDEEEVKQFEEELYNKVVDCLFSKSFSDGKIH